MDANFYAPIIIPTLCRYNHFVKCISSLQKNTWAEHTEVYIGVDYPTKGSHWDGYRKIISLVSSGIHGFKNVHVIIREKNFGVNNNAADLIRHCTESYDRYIITDDDVEFSPNFIQYMDLALEKYQDDDSVIAVTGYAYPVKWKNAEGMNCALQNFTANTWGIGRWKDKTNAMYKYLSSGGLKKDFSKAYRNGKFSRMTDWAIKDYVSMVTYGQVGSSYLKRNTDISMRLYCAVKDKYVLIPFVSKSRNLGFDGSGVSKMISTEDQNAEEYTSANYPFSKQPIDEDLTFELKVDDSFDIDHNKALLSCFDFVDPKVVKECLHRADKYSQMNGISRMWIECMCFAKKVMKKIL